MSRIMDEFALIFSRLASVKVRLAENGDEGEAQALQDDIVEPLRDISLDLDNLDLEDSAPEVSDILQVEAKRKGTKKRKAQQPRLRWDCCKTPIKGRTRRGEAVWKAWCKWNKGAQSGGMVRVVGKGKNGKPRKPMGTTKRC